MKKILFILLSLFLLTSCTSEVDQKENSQLLNRTSLNEITEADENYAILNDYSYYLSNDFEGDYASVDDLQVFFDRTQSGKKAKVIFHEHHPSNSNFHFVTIQSHGNYYLVFVNTEYSPPRTILYPFGAHNPCGQVMSYLP